jgi:hypothetical protein
MIILTITSCQKELIQKEQSQKKMNDLNVSASFDWNTSTDYLVSISSTTSQLVKIASAEGVIYQKGMTKPNEAFKATVKIPSYIKTVKLITADKNVEYVLKDSKINYTFK